MAFGNGSPDIFSSIASVISVKQPQAGLAISCLLGNKFLIKEAIIFNIFFFQALEYS